MTYRTPLSLNFDTLPQPNPPSTDALFFSTQVCGGSVRLLCFCTNSEVGIGGIDAIVEVPLGCCLLNVVASFILPVSKALKEIALFNISGM
jgi:hypothetical protein